MQLVSLPYTSLQPTTRSSRSAAIISAALPPSLPELPLGLSGLPHELALGKIVITMAYAFSAGILFFDTVSNAQGDYRLCRKAWRSIDIPAYFAARAFGFIFCITLIFNQFSPSLSRCTWDQMPAGFFGAIEVLTQITIVSRTCIVWKYDWRVVTIGWLFIMGETVLVGMTPVFTVVFVNPYNPTYCISTVLGNHMWISVLLAGTRLMSDCIQFPLLLVGVGRTTGFTLRELFRHFLGGSRDEPDRYNFLPTASQLVLQHGLLWTLLDTLLNVAMVTLIASPGAPSLPHHYVLVPVVAVFQIAIVGYMLRSWAPLALARRSAQPSSDRQATPPAPQAPRRASPFNWLYNKPSRSVDLEVGASSMGSSADGKNLETMEIIQTLPVLPSMSQAQSFEAQLALEQSRRKSLAG